MNITEGSLTAARGVYNSRFVNTADVLLFLYILLVYYVLCCFLKDVLTS